MNFKNRLTTDNLLNSTNLVTAVFILTTIVVLWRGCAEEEPKAPPVAAKKKVLRVGMPKERPAPSPVAVSDQRPDTMAPFLEPVIAGASFYNKKAEKLDVPAINVKEQKTAEHEKPDAKKTIKMADKPKEPQAKEVIKKATRPPEPAAQEGIYKVARGETLYEIAGKKHI